MSKLVFKNVYGELDEFAPEELLGKDDLYFFRKRMSEKYKKVAQAVKAKNPSKAKTPIQFKNAMLTPDAYYDGWQGDVTAEMLEYAPVIQLMPFTSFFQFLGNQETRGAKNIAGRLQNILRAYQKCSSTWVTADSKILPVKWQCEEMGFKLAFCAETLEDTVFSNILATGVDRGNIFGTPLQAIIDRIMFSALTQDFERVLFTGDKTSGDASYNFFNGVYKKLLDIEAAQTLTPPANVNDKMNVVKITALDGSTNSPLVWLRKLIDEASPVLQQAALTGKADYQGAVKDVSLFIRVDSEFEKLYRRFLQDKELLVKGDTQLTINGIDYVAVDGIPVIGDFMLTQALADPNCPLADLDTVNGKRHIGYMSHKENWWIIGAQENAYSQIVGFYDEVGDRNLFRSAFLTDVVTAIEGMNALMYTS
jgi:hypothetical protein